MKCPDCIPTQGRACHRCLNATRSALGLSLHRIPGLHTEEGGMEVNGGISFPMELEHEPSEPAEETKGWAAFGLYLLAAITATCIGGVVVAGIRLFANN